MEICGFDESPSLSLQIRAAMLASLPVKFRSAETSGPIERVLQESESLITTPKMVNR